MKPKIVTIIPARGGSKGVPRKNIRLLNGKPLVVYTIEASLNSGVIDREFVSTDDQEIAKVSKKFGAEVIDRPKGLAGDKVTLEPVIKHALDYLEEKENYIPDFVSCIQPTSPLLKLEIVRECIDKVISQGFDSCITAFLPETYEWKWRPVSDESGKENHFEPEVPVMKRVVRQDLPKVFHENGAFYITKTSLFREIGHRWGGKMAIVEMGEEDSLQIDSEYQFWLIEQIFKRRKNENK